jgi:hypothetical protein
LDRAKWWGSVLVLGMVVVSHCAHGRTSAATKDPHANSQESAEVAAALPLQLAEGAKPESLFSWHDLKAGGVVLSIWNGSEKSLQLSAEVSALDSYTAGVGSGATSIAVTITPSSLTAEPYSINRFTLALKGTGITPRDHGSYAGVLIIKSLDPKFAPFVQRLRINALAPQPAVSKLTFVAWRIVPFLPLWRSTGDLPLVEPFGTGQLADRNRIVGIVHRSSGGFATVRWTTSECTGQDVPSLARLVVSGLPSAGQYDGDVALGGMIDRATPVTLTVLAKDIVLWPLLVMALGTYVAWGTKRYVGVLRIVWNLRKQEAELGTAFEENQKRFIDAAKGASFASYSISKDIASQRGAICQKLTALEKIWTTSIDNSDDYKAVVAALQTLQMQISQWGLLGPDLGALQDALQAAQNGIDGHAMIPATADPGNPQFIGLNECLLRGKALLGTEVATLRKQTADATSLAKLWNDANQHAKDLTGAFTSLRGSHVGPDQQGALADIQKRLVAAWQHLWTVQSIADLAAITVVNGDLDSAQIGLAEISAQKQTEQRLALFPLPSRMLLTFPVQLLADEGPSPPSISASTTDSSEVLASDIRRAEMFTRSIHLGDTASLVVAFVIAILTGLSSNYLGKPFGTIQDYAALFLWAAGTKVALDILSSVLDKFVTPNET